MAGHAHWHAMTDPAGVCPSRASTALMCTIGLRDDTLVAAFVGLESRCAYFDEGRPRPRRRLRRMRPTPAAAPPRR